MVRCLLLGMTFLDAVGRCEIHFHRLALDVNKPAGVSRETEKYRTDFVSASLSIPS